MLVAMVPFGRFLKAFEQTEKFARENGRNIPTVGYPFEGIVLFHAIFRCRNSTAKARKETLAEARKLMEQLMDLGSIPHRIGTDFLPVLIPRLDPAYAAFVNRIKEVLDPNRILHPGVILPDNT